MAKLRSKPAGADYVSIFMRFRLPANFTVPTQHADSVADRDIWARHFGALRQEPGGINFIALGRKVEDPSDALLMVGMRSHEKLDTLLESSQYKHALGTLGLEQPAPYFSVAEPAMMGPPDGMRMTTSILTFAHPASEAQREVFSGADIGGVPVHESFYPQAGSRSSFLMPRISKCWVNEKQDCNGREAEIALMMQPWLSKECEEVSFGEYSEARTSWEASVSSRLSLLSVQVDRWDFYRL